MSDVQISQNNLPNKYGHIFVKIKPHYFQTKAVDERDN